jgi:hypothetical protein
MQLDYSFDARSDCLLVKVGGTFEVNAAKALVDAIAVQCRQSDHRCVLVDAMEVDGEPSAIDRYAVGVRVAEMLRMVKTAVVYPEQRINKLAENVAVNRGALLLVTGDRDEALRWLGLAPCGGGGGF